MAQSLVRGFSADWLVDFSFNSPGSLHRYGIIILLIGLVAIPVNSVLAGGVIARFRESAQAASSPSFWHDTGRYAWRLLRLAVIALICYWIIFRVLHQALGEFVNDRTRGWLDDRPVFWVHLGAAIPLLLALGLVNLIVDFARVRLVMEDEMSALAAFLRSLIFSVRRLGRAVTVWAIPSLCGLAFLVLYRAVFPWHLVNSMATTLSYPTGKSAASAHYQIPLAFIIIFAVQQIVIFGRYWFRAATWASEWKLYAGERPAPPAEE